jgi:Reticulon
VPRLLREGISESQAKQLVDSYVPMVNRALGECMQRVSCSALQLLPLSTFTTVSVLAMACLATTVHLTKPGPLLAALLYRVCTGRDAVLAAEVLLCIFTVLEWSCCEQPSQFRSCNLQHNAAQLRLQVVVALIVISKLGKIFSVLTWAYLAVLIAFSAPKFYELKKPEIDDALTTGHARTKQLYDQHVAPQGAFIHLNSLCSCCLCLVAVYQLRSTALQCVTCLPRRHVKAPPFPGNTEVYHTLSTRMLTDLQWPRSRVRRLRRPFALLALAQTLSAAAATWTPSAAAAPWTPSAAATWTPWSKPKQNLFDLCADGKSLLDNAVSSVGEDHRLGQLLRL